MEKDLNLNLEETQEPKVAYAYSVIHYEDGSLTVENKDIEGVAPVRPEEIYKDIEELAENVKMKRIENAAFRGVMRFFREAQNSKGE